MEVIMMKRFLALCITVLFVISVAGLALADGTGTVTKIDGKKITIKDDKGKETTAEVKDAAGAKVGDKVEIKAGAVKIMKPAEKKPAAGGY